MAASFVPMLALLTIVMVTLSDTKTAQAANMMEPTRLVNNKRHDSNDETQANHTTKVCIGSKITLDWDHSISRGKEVEVVKWFFSPSTSNKSFIIATFANGFLAKVPAYRSRLHHLGRGSFVLSGVTPSDAGTFRVEILMEATGSYFTVHSKLAVTVADATIYRSNKLKLKMHELAVFVNTSKAEDGGELQIQLTCGPITWRGEPPVDVVWKTPSGSNVNSTYFKNGLYFLRLDNPVEDGVYSCCLEPRAVTALCLKADDRLLSKASLQVNAVDIRIVLLEGEQQRLKAKQNNRLARLDGEVFRVLEEQQHLKGEIHRMKGELEEYRNKSSAHVGFFARLSKTIYSLNNGSESLNNGPESLNNGTKSLNNGTKSLNNGTESLNNGSGSLNTGSHLTFDHIHYNYGEAYDSNTGVFTAPLNGAYCFAFTTIAPEKGSNGSCRLNVNGTVVAYAFAQFSNYRESASGQAVVHLNEGSKVWVESNGKNHSYYSWAHFSGFLIHPDWVLYEETRPLAAQQDKDIVTSEATVRSPDNETSAAQEDKDI